jgi:ABC-type multidrug transport system fused ATPase/permease subunit
VALLINGRRQRKRFGFRLRPMWAEVTLGIVGCVAVLGSIWFLNRYYLPEGLARQYAEDNQIPWPEGGLNVSAGLAVPVLIALAVAMVMTFLTTRRRYGRYVYAIGGNPEAAELAGINSKRTIIKTFALMGALVGLAAAVQIARLNAAVSGLGQLTELYVIAAAVIGGTSLAGGIGSIPGAVLGALLMQSLQSGMVLMNVDAPMQNIVVGIVLVIAVTLDTVYRRRSNSGGRHDRRPVPLVELRDIHVAFGGVKAVDGVTVDLHPGEVVALVGGNGAGKTTLIKALSGAHPADSGQILIEGKPVTISTPRDAKNLGVETIYQTLALADNVDAPSNVFLGRELTTRWGNLDSSAMEDATRKLMARLNPKFENFISRSSRCPAGSASRSRSLGPCTSTPGS